MDTESDNHPDLAFNVSFGQNFPPQPKIFFPWNKSVIKLIKLILS